jgi:hypothetical protein
LDAGNRCFVAENRGNSRFQAGNIMGMGWIAEEFDRLNLTNVGTSPDWLERQLEHAALNKWLELRDALQADVAEFNRYVSGASFEQISESQVRIAGRELAVLIVADAVEHNIRYDYEARQKQVAAPEGGFFSMRISPSGQAQIFSADQEVALEQARRMLLQPVLFPAEPSEEMLKSA